MAGALVLTSTHRDPTIQSLYWVLGPVLGVVTAILIYASLTTPGSWWLPLLVLLPAAVLAVSLPPLGARVNADASVQFRLALAWTPPLTDECLARCSLRRMSTGARSIGLHYQRRCHALWFVRIDYRPSGFTDAPVLASAVAAVVAHAEAARPGCATRESLIALKRWSDRG